MFGVAGPAFAAALMRMRQQDAHTLSLRFPLELFLFLVPACWAALVLAIATGAGFQPLDWNPLLMLPALLPALSAAFFVGAGEIRWQGWIPWAVWHAPLDFTGGGGRTWLNYLKVRVVFFIAIAILLM